MKSYKVFLDGNELKIHSVMVSAQRFNRIWEGKQRTKDQTEVAYYVDFDFEKPIVLTVEVEGENVESVEIRPLQKKYEYRVNGNQIEIKVNEIGHFSVEVNGYHSALAVFVNPLEKYEPKENDIYFGAGVHNVGLIMPENGQRVYIDKDAIVYGTIYAIGKTGVSIEGRGVLDASKYIRPWKMENAGCGIDLFESVWDETMEQREPDVINQLKEGYDSLILRQSKAKGILYRYNCPMGIITAYGCRDMKISGVILRDSFFWTLILRNGCDNVEIDNIKIIGQWRYNSDGVNVCDSNNVVVKNCFIRSFDDCIVVRGGYRATGSGYGCRNIKIENNICWCDWGKVFEIWSGDCNSEISDVTIQNNFAIRIAYIAFSIDMKYGCERTIVRDITYKDIFVEYDEIQERLQLQKTDEQKYDATKIGRNELLIFIGVGALGKNLGNQQILQIEDELPYIGYENICFENICENQPYGEILLKIEKLTNFSNVTIDNNNIEDIAKKRILTIFEE